MALRKADLEKMFEVLSQGCDYQLRSELLKPTGRGGVYAARDYIAANSYLTELRRNNAPLSQIKTVAEAATYLPAVSKFRLRYYTPALAYRYDELKPEAQKALFEKPQYIFYNKENGIRGWIIMNSKEAALFSRNYSDVDCGLLDYWKNISQDYKLPPKAFAIDVEVKYEPEINLISEMEKYGITTESKLEAMSALLQTRPEVAREIQEKYKRDYGKDLVVFRLIYPLFYNGVNYINEKMGKGMEVYDEVVAYAKSIGLNVEPIQRCKGTKQEKEAFLDSILTSGGEGVVIHNSNGYYCTSENRDRECMVKLKRSVAASASHQGVGDTIDAYVTGFKMSNDGTANEGLVGSLELSIHMLKDNGTMVDHIIAYVPNIPRELKKVMTMEDNNGDVMLNPDYMGMVVEVDGQAISAKSRRLTHPRMLNFRMDKNANDCIYTEAFLNSQIDKAL